MDEAQVSILENIMDEAQVSLPENPSLKFLMPSRRHHPQVEPLLDTCKIWLSQKVAKSILSLQGTIFLTKNCWLLKNFESLMPLSKPSPLFPSWKVWNLAKFPKRVLLQAPFSPSSSSKNTLFSYPFTSHEKPSFFYLSPFHFIKNPW